MKKNYPGAIDHQGRFLVNFIEADAAAACWRQFVASVRAERPMTLPNLVRLYRRRAAVLEQDASDSVDSMVASGAALLTSAYRRQQSVRRQRRRVLRE